MLKCLIYLMNFQNFKTEILHVQHNENRATWIFHQLSLKKKKIDEVITNFSL